MTGLLAVGESANHPSVAKSVDWLLDIQHDDGGFGESCGSDRVKKFITLPFSTLSQTAWALDALIAVFDKPNEPMKRACSFLVRELNTPGPAGLPNRRRLTWTYV